MKNIRCRLGLVVLLTCLGLAPINANAYSNYSSMVSSELDRKDHLLQTDRLEKVSVSAEQVLQALAQERGGDRVSSLNVYVLGTNESFRVWSFEIERGLSNQLGSDYHTKYDFVKTNNKWISGGETLLLIKKTDYLLNSLEEFNAIVRKTIQDFDLKEKSVFASFNLNESIPLKLLLANAGLSIGQQSYQKTMGSQTIYSRKIRMMNYVEGVGNGSIRGYENTNAGLYRYLTNDEKIKELIKKSGALSETTEKGRLRKWCLYVTNTFQYDLGGGSIDDKAAYYRAADIFSVTERQKAVCVGYSAITARALNLMGIKAYVVGGINHKGIPHQITRVHYDGSWYFLDTTSGNLPGKRVKIEYFGRVYTPVEMTVREATGIGEMEYSKDFEDWMVRSQPSEWLIYGSNISGEKASATTYLTDNAYANLFKSNLESRTNLFTIPKESFDTYTNQNGSVISKRQKVSNRPKTSDSIVSEGVWYRNEWGYYRYAVNGYFVQNKWVKDGHNYYYCDDDCNAVTGWHQIDGSWYFFDRFGRLS
ncbi:transglutaminase domain-containing protein [Streptococcus castoreus]|uniref:transglutaminase domain-containing protein n=1 Tax=Streptococcus castoreus TaxID=254786 RepID=UPI00047F14F4|nr:transglutaminase domain-containing protein [Streptococcus castoreus]